MDEVTLVFALLPFLGVGFFMGLATNPFMRAKIKKRLPKPFGSEDPGIFFRKGSGRGIKMFIRDFSKEKIDIKNGSYPIDSENVYDISGVSVAFANMKDAKLVSLEPKEELMKVSGKCPSCGKDITVPVVTKQNTLNPKVYNDIIIGAINWGKSLVMNKILPTILIGLLIVGLIALVSAVLGYNNGNGIGDTKAVCQASYDYMQNLNLSKCA